MRKGFGEYKVVWKGFAAGDDNEQLRSDGFSPITNPYPDYTWETAEYIKGDSAGSTGTRAWHKFYNKHWTKEHVILPRRPPAF